MRESYGTYLGASRRDGIVRYTSHRRLRDFPLFVTYGVLESEVLAPSRYRARVFYAGAALLSLLLVGFATLLTVVLNRRERREAEMAQADIIGARVPPVFAQRDKRDLREFLPHHRGASVPAPVIHHTHGRRNARAHRNGTQAVAEHCRSPVIDDHDSKGRHSVGVTRGGCLFLS